jgi:uncharacterized protein
MKFTTVQAAVSGHPGAGVLGIAGTLVGLVIGLTGMGGGVLLTPLLVLVFGINPAAAVSSDVVVSLLIKPFGVAVHRRAGTIQWPIVRWLTLGSVPGAVIGTVAGRRYLADHESSLKAAIGITLLIAGSLMAFRAITARRHSQRAQHQRTQSDIETTANPTTTTLAPVTARPVPTAVIGLVGGLFVGATSVGSGSLILALLLGVYPMLKASHLVGTDLAQAIPLVGAAAIAHLFIGEVQVGLVAPLVLGAIPGVIIGGLISSRVAESWIRPIIATVLLGSGLKLVNIL